MGVDFYNREIVTTADGSSSIYLPDFDEHYHSSHGAVQESKHVFMKMGWEEAIKGKTSINILEVGFGTGLNAWLVLLASADQEAPEVHYTTLEAYPVSLEQAAEFNYCSPEDRDLFLQLHRLSWNEAVVISPKFILEKVQAPLQEFRSPESYDLIFFDAFAPRVQPELWTTEIFGKMFSLMNPGGILVTYCSKGEVRRNMIAAGFAVEKLPGPPGKREMLRAVRK